MRRRDSGGGARYGLFMCGNDRGNSGAARAHRRAPVGRKRAVRRQMCGIARSLSSSGGGQETMNLLLHKEWCEGGGDLNVNIDRPRRRALPRRLRSAARLVASEVSCGPPSSRRCACRALQTWRVRRHVPVALARASGHAARATQSAGARESRQAARSAHRREARRHRPRQGPRRPRETGETAAQLAKARGVGIR